MLDVVKAPVQKPVSRLAEASAQILRNEPPAGLSSAALYAAYLMQTLDVSSSLSGSSVHVRDSHIQVKIGFSTWPLLN